MYIYTVTITRIFNILIIFSLSLSLLPNSHITLHCCRSLFFFLNSRDLSDLSPWLTEWCHRSSIWYSSEPKWCRRLTSFNLIFNQIAQNDGVVPKWCYRSSIWSSIRSLKNSETKSLKNSKTRSPKLESCWGRRRVR